MGATNILVDEHGDLPLISLKYGDSLTNHSSNSVAFRHTCLIQVHEYENAQYETLLIMRFVG